MDVIGCHVEKKQDEELILICHFLDVNKIL